MPKKQSSKRWTLADLAFAYEQAADFLSSEEWPEDDGGRQVAAYREVGRRLRATSGRLREMIAEQQRAQRESAGQAALESVGSSSDGGAPPLSP